MCPGYRPAPNRSPNRHAGQTRTSAQVDAWPGIRIQCRPVPCTRSIILTGPLHHLVPARSGGRTFQNSPFREPIEESALFFCLPPMSSLRLPGLIDPHVHARDLSQAHKEDWDSCTAAALAGGITCVLAMPNTQPPVTDADSLAGYEQAAQARARCDYGIFLGAGPGNVAEAAQLAPRAAGLKMYLDSTFGNLKMDGLDLLVEHVSRWPRSAPLAAHAEGSSLAAVILAAHLAGRSVHLCHVSRKDEI